MACSNNVVRAGLTPKAIDKETLLSMLTYEYISFYFLLFYRCGDVVIYHPTIHDIHYSTVETPAQEFMLEIFTLKKGEKYQLPTLPVPRILITFNGIGKTEKELELKYNIQ